MSTLINIIDQTINFNEFTIRIVGTHDKPLFVASDICKVLGLSNVTETLKNLPDKWKEIHTINMIENESKSKPSEKDRPYIRRKELEMNCITEAGLYRIIMRSNKEIAQPFQEAVCEEILPSLRKTGEYKIQSIIDKNKELEDEKLKLSEELHKEQCLVVKQQQSLLYQQEKVNNRQKLSRTCCVYVVHDPCWKFTKYKIGVTNDFNQRVAQYRTLAPEIKTSYILYTAYYELFEECIKLKFAEFAEQPSHEIFIMELKDIINGIKEINKVVGFNGYEEKELWKLNNEQPPNIDGTVEEYKSAVNYIMPLCMKDGAKYIDKKPDEEIRISMFLQSRISEAEYKTKNESAPDGTRYCNSFCQKFCTLDQFQLKSKFLFTSCENCRIMEKYAIYKIENNIYTADQIANNPHLVFLDTNQKLCPHCDQIKHKSQFRENRQQCKKCKEIPKTKRRENFKENIDAEINTIKNNMKNIDIYEKKIEFLETYNRDNIYSICQHFKITRRSADNKNNMIAKLVNHLQTES